MTSVVLVGCSANTATEPTPTTTTTTRIPRVTDNSVRPPITFDPCLDIPDEAMEELGYDARDKDVDAYPMGAYSFLGCSYRSPAVENGLRQFSLSILAGNVTLDEELAKVGDIATPTQINGRRALLEIDESSSGDCTYVLETEFGLVLYCRTHYKLGSTPVPRDQWCIDMEHLVATLESYL
ncbi:DUF3558 domain-containing protein [Rhodococcus yananensis]|uniref:DUF3558 domain-containing protein n=1 Tax=Rhodococcus yananensis TaxID=2879464 RepID=UPI001CF91DCB|nr:DUF3558 domain-containing protein [Rhodococcus yananensis]